MVLNPYSNLWEDPDENGNLFNPSMIPQQTLPAPSQVQGGFSPEFDTKYGNVAGAVTDKIGGAYDYNVDPATAALFDTNQVPQPQAQQFQAAGYNPATAGPAAQAQAQSYGYSPELQAMLAGQGFDPSTLAALRSSAMEQAAGAGTQEMAAARRAISQAGYDGSLAGAGVQADVARRVGQAQSGALRDIDIQNALTGMENKRLGLGQQTQIGLANTDAANRIGMFNANAANEMNQFNTGQVNQGAQFNAGQYNQVGLSNMEQANQMAMQNASRLFSAMQQNTQNQQQANMATFGQKSDQAAQKANAVGQSWNQFGQQYNNASLGKQANADIANTDSANQFKLQQANLNQDAAVRNQGTLEDRFKLGMGMSQGFNPLAG